MIGYPVTYTDFNDNEATETLWFHLSQPELIEWELSVDGGLKNMIQRVLESNNDQGLIMQFKDFILRSYGVRSPDGKRFIKNEQLKEELVQSAAYHHLFMELATDSKKAADFLIGTLPKELQGDVQTAAAQLQAQPTPTQPTT
jgi:hypothetical protein